jgi:hypothetical protein
VAGDKITPVAGKVPVPGPVVSHLADGVVVYSLVDTEELPHGVMFNYFVTATFDDGTVSGPSNFATITAVNDAPMANADSYTVNQGGSLAVAARGVLLNDTDDDSSLPSLTAIIERAPAHGVLVLNADGAFTYTPVASFAWTPLPTGRKTSPFQNLRQPSITVRTSRPRWSRSRFRSRMARLGIL